MSKKRTGIPLWIHFVLDLLCIALCSSLFYYAYYRIPTELESENIVIQRTNSSVSKAAVSELTSSAVNNSENSTPSEPSVDLSDWAVKFADHFSDTVVSTDNSYRSPDVSITLTQYTKGAGNSLITYFVANIYIAKIDCLQTGFAYGKYGVGYAEDLQTMSASLGAVLAINGDYYGNSRSGVVIRNGILYPRDADSSDVCVLYYDGTMKTFSPEAFDINQAIAEGAYQAWSFGPLLLSEDGSALTEFNSSVTPKNPRSAIGYFEPGHYCFVLVDGRQTGYSCGMTMTELSALMNELGCVTAYNLDGGQSSAMTLYNKVINSPYKNGRPVSDCILIKEIN